MPRKKHVPITIPIEGGGQCVAHVDPDASPELVPALKEIARAAYRLAREEAKLEKAVCDAALDLLADHEMDPVPHNADGSYGRVVAKAKALRQFRYKRRPNTARGKDEGNAK